MDRTALASGVLLSAIVAASAIAARSADGAGALATHGIAVPLAAYAGIGLLALGALAVNRPTA